MSEEIVSGFTVSSDVYNGPFDVLLSLIAQRKLEVTQLTLSNITEEFIRYVASMNLAEQANEASEFLVVASVLVEAKSAALLPGNENTPENEQSLEALRERDLLFARLLQYKAFKQAGETLRGLIASNSGRYAHQPQLDASQRSQMANIEWTLSAFDFALIAAKVFANAPAQTVSLKQLHVTLADLQAESATVHAKLSALRGASVSFDDLISDVTHKGQVVARFLSVLAFFKLGFIQFKQEGAFEPLHLRWVASEEDYAEHGRLISTEDFS